MLIITKVHCHERVLYFKSDFFSWHAVQSLLYDSDQSNYSEPEHHTHTHYTFSKLLSDTHTKNHTKTIMAKTLTKRSSASDKKPLLSEAEVTKRVADAYKNPGGWVHYKLAFFFLLLCAAAGGCLYKATQLQEGIQVSWDAYDHHCHDHPDPSMDCAHHLIVCTSSGVSSPFLGFLLNEG